MSLPLLVVVLASISEPAQEFSARYPGSSTIRSADGHRLVHASNFVFDGDASAFVARFGAALGASDRQALVLRSTSTNVARFQRLIDGLEVFGGDVALGVDAENRVFVVNAADVSGAVSGRHVVGETAAVLTATSFAANAGTPQVAIGWLSVGVAVRPVYRVDFLEPKADWRVFVDGETGRMLFRENRRMSAQVNGSVYEVSPVETKAGFCPVSGPGYSFCATPVVVSFTNLDTGTSLNGSQTAIYNCKGLDVNAPGCSSVLPSGGVFTFTADATFVSPLDNFAAAMAYFHLDKQVSFLKSLEPTIPPVVANGPSSALRGSLPALVNVKVGGQPLENAYFSPQLDAMVFGQGAAGDFAYDATIAYHEFNHGAVQAWGGFNPGFDLLGWTNDGRSLNEGTADALAASQNGRSQIGSYFAATLSPAERYLRDLNDPTASRTCQGDGTLIKKFGVENVINGLDGESHDDGEIWNGFFWEVYSGLRASGLKGCNGACDAAPLLQYKAVQLVGGTSPSFNSYWQTMRAAAVSTFPAQSGAAAFIDCVAERRKLASCDRTVTVHAGETKVQYLDIGYSTYQTIVPATAATSVQICSLLGTSLTVHKRLGRPVEMDWVAGTFTDDGEVTFTKACSAGTTDVTLGAVGNWYLLFQTSATDVIRLAPGAGTKARPAAVTPKTCAPPLLAVTPAVTATSPKGSLALGAFGGSGAGYTFSFVTNASGGTLAADGAYAAGAMGSVTDVVKVTDSLGNAATRDVLVSAGLSTLPATPETYPRGSVALTVSGGSGQGYVWSLTANPSGGSITSAGSYVAGSTGGVTDVFQVVDSAGNSATGNIVVSQGLSIAPATASTSPRGQLTFSSSGGSGVGAVWSLTSNASGATITPAGVYTAGATGNVIDVIAVTDSTGRTTRDVTVTGPVAISPQTGSVAPKGTLAFSATGGSGTGFVWSLTAASGGSITAVGAYTAGSIAGTFDVVKVVDSLGNSASVTVGVTGAIAIAPAMSSVAPKGTLAFTATGGSGAGFVWSLASAPSGASITAAGEYTAGAAGSTFDVVKVVDSLGNSAVVTVSVTSAIIVTPGLAFVVPKSTVTFLAAGGSGTGFTWSLTSSPSGGTISSSGAYVAGSVGEVADVVQVTDSLGNTASSTVTISKPGCGCNGTSGGPALFIFAVALFMWRRTRSRSTRGG